MSNELRTDLTPRLRKRQAPPSPPPAPTEPPADPYRRPNRWRKPLDYDRPGEAPRDTFPYWMVWNKHKKWMPKFRHPSEESARTEAQRLAGLNPGRRFYLVRIDGYELAEPTEQTSL